MKHFVNILYNFYNMWLPIEIVNIIMEYAGTGQYLYYCYKY